MKTTWKVHYETEVITSNTVIKPKSFSSIVFRNVGDTDVTILNNIPIKGHVTGSNYYDEYFFINRPGEIIDNDMPVQFSTLVTTKQLLTTKVFYEENIIAEPKKDDKKSSDNTVKADFIDYSNKDFPIKK
jgi:hypothetical protein